MILSIRVTATAKMTVNRTSGRTSPPEAAEKTFDGMIPEKKSAIPGAVPGMLAGSMVASPARSACDAPSGRGNAYNRGGIASAPSVAEAV